MEDNREQISLKARLVITVVATLTLSLAQGFSTNADSAPTVDKPAAVSQSITQ